MILQTKHKIFIASFAFRLVRLARKIQGKGLQGRFKRNSFYWELDLREVIDFMIYLSGSFEGDLNRFIRRNLTDGDIALDIGANVGAHTLQMGKRVGNRGKVYAIEATDYAYSKLQANIALNPPIQNQIEAIHCLLESNDSTEEETVIHSSWPFESDADRHPSHQGVFKSVGNAQRLTLDALVQSQNITRIDMIKLDVDGHEWDVLSGGIKTFDSMRPIILMEVAPDYHAPSDAKGFYNIHKLLHGLDYTLYDFRGNMLPQKAEDLAAMIPGGASKNVVALPPQSKPLKFN